MSERTGTDAAVVTLENVFFEIDGFNILHDVNASIREERSTVIMGHAGSGKSTLLKVAAGLLMPTKGKVILEGKEITRMTSRENLQYRKDHGFVFQDAALWANMTIYQNLALPLEIHGMFATGREIAEKIRRITARFSFHRDLHIRPSQLSTGEQKIVSFMRALISEPRVLFLDEPTASIDNESMDMIHRIIREYRQNGNTVIAVTHDSNLASLIADELILIRGGEIIAAGPFDTVVKTANRDAASILSEVMNQAATFDTDILDLLTPDADNGVEP